MRTLKFWKVVTIVLALSLVVLPTTAYAAEDGTETESTEESWLDRAKAAGSSAVDWVKDKAPAVKEKASELWDKTKEKAGEARDDFREWNQNQEKEFWDRTNEQLNGDESSVTEEPEGTGYKRSGRNRLLLTAAKKAEEEKDDVSKTKSENAQPYTPAQGRRTFSDQI